MFRIDVYFNEYLLAVEVDEKDHIDRDFIFEKKRQEALEKNLGCKFIGINASREGYESSRIKQPVFNRSACGPFTKNKERIEKFILTGNTACF